MTAVNLSLPPPADDGLESLVFASAREQAQALADGRVTLSRVATNPRGRA